jgi:predicted permease
MVAVKVVGIFAIVLVGFLACKAGWLPLRSSAYLSKIVLFIACPCVLFLAIARQEYSAASIHTMLLLMAVSVVLYVLSFLIGFLFCRIFKVPRAETGLYVNFCTTPNNGFIGIPVALAIFGQPILFMIALLNMIQAFFLYSLGTHLLRTRSGTGDDKTAADSNARTGYVGQNRRGAVQLLKDFFLPPVVGCLAGTVFFLFRIPVPDAAADVIETVGATMTPLCMMFIGIQLTESSPRRLFANRRLLAASLFRLILIPVLFFALLLPLWKSGLPVRIDSLFLCAVTINFMTPIGAAIPPLAEIYGGSVKLASEGVFLSTLLSMATIPIASVFLAQL